MYDVRAQGVDERMIMMMMMLMMIIISIKIIIIFPTAVIVKASRQLYWVACAPLWLHDVGLGEDGSPNVLNLWYIGPMFTWRLLSFGS